MNTALTQAQLCAFDGASQWLVFGPNVPALVYYSHIPVIFLSLALGLFVLLKARKEIASFVFFYTILAFVGWVYLDSVFWASNRSDIIMFAWSVIILLEPLVYFGGFYLIYVLTEQKYPPLKAQIIGLLAYLPLLILTPTAHILSNFDLTTCLATETTYAYYTYVLEIATLVALLVYAFRKYFSFELDNSFARKRLLYLTLGTLLFLLAFAWGNITGSFTDNWQLGQYGLLGMPIFLAFIGYLMVRFKMFHIKLIATQALIVAVWFLLFALIFINDLEKIQNVIVVTIGLFGLLGYQLVQSVSREVQQRERIENLARDLGLANDRLKELDKLKSEFVSIASHQLRSPLAAIKGYASMLLEGSFGKLSVGSHEAVGRIFSSSALMARSVEDFLNVSRIELGRMKYDLSQFDVCKLIETVIEEQAPIADDKKLKLKFFKDKTVNTCDVFADIGKIKQVVTNFVDNAIKYTPRGTVTVTFSRDLKRGVARIGVTDTGIGMSPETIKKLFAKFARADNANKVNVIGTGLGLFVAKQLVEAHGGRVWAESPGDGKGSTFFFELPLQAQGEAVKASVDESYNA